MAEVEVIEQDIQSGSGSIQIPGRLIINGSILSGASVFAGGDIIVRGRIHNAFVESHGGGVYVDEGISGDGCTVRAIGDVKAKSIKKSRVETQGSVYVRDMIFKATVKAHNFVKVTDGSGIIEESYVEAGIEISVKSIGSFHGDVEETKLVLENYRQKELFELNMIYDQRLNQKKERIGELKKVIEVIRIIGSRVSTLSPEKKQELALKVKEFNELNDQVKEIQEEKLKVLAEKDKAGTVFRSVVASAEVFAGVQVRIDNAKVVTNKKYQNVIFYKSGIVIIGDLDAFMERKRQSV